MTDETLGQANFAFYRAYESRALSQMDALWSQTEHVQCIHPGWLPRLGWAQVRNGWETLFAYMPETRIMVCVMESIIKGNIGWLICQEHLTVSEGKTPVEGLVMATNLFEYQSGRWWMIHHHGSPFFSEAAVSGLHVLESS